MRSTGWLGALWFERQRSLLAPVIAGVVPKECPTEDERTREQVYPAEQPFSVDENLRFDAEHYPEFDWVALASRIDERAGRSTLDREKRRKIVLESEIPQKCC